ncbi:salicylate hydroxylase [Agrobacterium vitis]|nr:salicylate hydroxylase [Agrobacterium vitis]MBE1438375.1 salicylate hydroxylase [Agrobacterium vitis]
MSTKTVAIVGGGIAGLAAALCFARKGIPTRIFEKSPVLEEVGAGLQLTPNVTCILRDLGLLPALQPRWFEPDVVALASGINLKRLGTVPVRDHAQRRWHAPYGVLHRASLQKVLADAVLQNPLCSLTLDQKVESPDAQVLRDPCSGQRPDLLIAADGVWSRLRNFVAGGPDITFSGNIAWRTTIPQDDAPAFIDRKTVTAFLGPKAHLVTYPLPETSSINVVAIASGEDVAEGWASPFGAAQKALLDHSFNGWNSTIREMLFSARQPTFWPLFEAGVGRWHNDKDLVLIGDAAHAMMPFAAQGAAMAIEDAFELANLVAKQPIAQALTQFEHQRSPRINKVRKRGALNKFAYHAAGPVRIGRDVLLSLRPPASFARDLDWLYGYRAPA